MHDVSQSEALQPRHVLAQLRWPIRNLMLHPPYDLWEEDTRTLPPPLARYRRRVRRFAEQVVAPHGLAADLDPHGPRAAEVLAAACRDGLMTDLLPAPFGSVSWRLARQPVAWVQSLKVEELCAADGGLGLMLGAHELGIIPLFLAGELGVIRRFVLPAYQHIRRGEPYVFAFAITEPGGGSDVEDTAGAGSYRPGTVARRVDGGWRLQGRKIFISGGDIASAVTVFAALEGEGMTSWTCFLVEASMPGFEVVRTELKMGQRASGAAELHFDDVFVPDDHVIGGVRQGWALNRATLNLSRIPVGAIALGIARGAFEAALRFVAQASLGGRPLLHYQDVQLAVADMIIDLAAMRALVWQSAQRWRSRQATSSITKAFCGDRAVGVCERAMDLLGNHAVRHTHGVEKAFRDARLTQIYEGTNQINRLAIIEDHLASLEALASAAESGA